MNLGKSFWGLALVAAVLFVAGQAYATPTVLIENHQVHTSLATGTLTGTGSVGQHYDTQTGDMIENYPVRAETDLSHELAHTIHTNNPYSLFAGLFGDHVEGYGTLSNYEFLTSNLTDRGNAGQQLADYFDQKASEALAPGTTGSYSGATITYLGNQNYNLFGGFLDENGNFLGDGPHALDNINDGTVTAVTGTAHVDFYSVTASLDVNGASPVPVPAALPLLLIGLAVFGIFEVRRRLLRVKV